ncbi:MAG: methyltransferase domain-containing protein [Alphaproteobacteria bacterium]|nr:methyltransferase domain-containing protein [Alphaproteobacteria bacterium]
MRNPRFQRFALDFPLTRRIAKARAAALFDVVAGFVYSQALAATVRLGVLETLAEKPASLDSLARGASISAASMARLMTAAQALQLVETLGKDEFALGPQGAALLGQPGLRDMIAHHDRLYKDLEDPVALLRAGRGDALGAYWPYANAEGAADARSVAAYSALMAATQPAVAADILHAYPMARHRNVMDVGGGEGAFLSAVGVRWPHLTLTLFDLPAVVDRARDRMAPLGSRAHFMEGDFLTEALPEGADLISFVRVLHDHDENGVRTLLASAHAALPRGGRVLIAEPMSHAPKPDPVCDAYFSFYFLAMGRGRCRTPETYRNALREAGFSKVFMLRMRTPALLRAIVGEV